MCRDDRTSPALVAARLGALVVGLFAFDSEPVRSETVSGTIRNPAGAGLAGASVTFTPLPFGSPIMATTDGSGHYSATLTPGCWAMRISASQFCLLLYPGTVYFEDEESIEVEAGQNQTGVDVQYPIGQSLGGTFAASGALPTAMAVRLYDRWGEGTTITEFFNSSPYSIPYVPRGTYVAFADDASFPRKYSGRYFSGANAIGGATVINLTANRNDINFSFLGAPHFKGHVERPGGGFGAGDRVVAYTRGYADPPIQVTTNASGDFDLSGTDFSPDYQGQLVAFGTSANPYWTAYGDTYGSFPATWLTAGPGDTTGLDIHALPPATIVGKVTDAVSGDPIASVSVQTFDPVQTYRLGANLFFGATNAAGDYDVRGIQPERRYGLFFSPQNSAANYYLGGRLEFFDVAPGVTTGKNVGLVKGGKFGGNVTAATGGAALDFVSVAVYETDCTTFKASGSTNAAGNYLTAPVPAGGYRLRFIPPLNLSVRETWYPNSATCAGGTTVNATAGNTTTANAALPSVPAGGHEVTGHLTDDVSGEAIGSTIVQLVRTSNSQFYFGFTDPCGAYLVPGLPDGTYDAFLSSIGYKTVSIPNALVVSGSDLVKDFTMTALNGGITGRVTSGGLPVQGAKVCTLSPQSCAQTDSFGYYWVSHLDTGTYNLIAYTLDGLEPEFWNNKTTKATADAVAVTNGSTTTGKDFTLVAVAADAKEPDATGTPGVLSRPEGDSGPERLLPNAPQTRAFRDTEDTDWFRFSATAGKVYKLAVTGGGFTQYGVYIGVFNATTHALEVASAGFQILSAGGWTPPTTGERWLGLGSAFSGSYTVTLTESSPGPPAPTVTSLSVTSGPAAGGTTVTITGTNFVSGATVKFGNVAATNVVFGSATSISCKSPALPAGSVNDVVVTNPGPSSGTLVKAWFADFSDVPQAYLYHAAIEKIVRAGLTTGCGAGKFCPDAAVTRDAMAKFLLLAKNGPAFNPPDATGDVFCDVAKGTLLAKWIEEFFHESFTTGCSAGACGKPNYCPTGVVTRDAMAKFLLLAKNGPAFNPDPATGNVFCDVGQTTLLAKWMEELKAENITGGCAAGACGKPNYCPTGIVTRGEMAKFLRVAFNL